MNELYHHGVLGMHWGVRRYQNKDGSLTPAGKKRYTTEYDKLTVKAQSEVARNDKKRYIDAYNKAASYMNETGIDKYNQEYRKKAESKGKKVNYDTDEYKTGMMDVFNNVLAKKYNEALYNEIMNNKNYKKAKSLLDQFSELKTDEIIKATENDLDEIRKLIK